MMFSVSSSYMAFIMLKLFPDSVGLPMAFWGTIQTPSSLHHLPDPSSHKRLVSKTRELPDPTVSLNHHFSDLSISQILIP